MATAFLDVLRERWKNEVAAALASELYDLENDLLEQNNLYDTSSDPDAATAQVELEAEMLAIRTGPAPIGCTR